MGYLLDDLRSFGINADHSATVAQEKEGRRKMADQGAERFMVKLMASEKVRVRLQHAAACPNVTERTRDHIARSRRVRGGFLTIGD